MTLESAGGDEASALASPALPYAIGHASVNSSMPLVSIVVHTKNAAGTLRRCLASIVSQTYRPIEIIVVDNFSTDSTVAIAREYTELVYLQGPERTTQSNLGFRAATGELTYLVDSDFVLDPRVVEEAADLAARGYDAVIIPNESDPQVSFWARVRALERHCYADDEWNVAARFFRSSVLRAVGGYDEELVAAEDYDLHNRLLRRGYRIGRTKSGEIHLGEPRTLREVVRKHYYYGRTLARFLAKNPDRGTRQLLPMRGAYIRHWRDFVRKPDLTAGFLVYQLVRYIAAWRGWSSERRKDRPT